MALTKRERAALLRLRDVVTMKRAALTAPARAAERGYDRTTEPTNRPLVAELDRDLSLSDPWTNDVAESLAGYLGTWALPIIDALLVEGRNAREPWAGTRDAVAAETYLQQVAHQ